MKKTINAYRKLFKILARTDVALIYLTFFSAIITGIIFPLSMWLNSKLINKALLVATNEMRIMDYIPYLILFLITAIIPVFIGGLFIYSYITPKCTLLFRTAYKKELLKKLKIMKYENIESPDSMEIIDKAMTRAENSAVHLFPMYVYETTQAIIATIGTLYLFATIKWWLLIIILVPFIIETVFDQSYSFDIYNELEKYWKDERRYTILGTFLRKREYLQENHIYEASDYLIDTYKTRINKRNKEYEKYFFKHLKTHFFRQNITRFAQIVIALLLLFFYTTNEITIGQLVFFTLNVFTNLFSWVGLKGCTFLFKSAPYHIQFFDYYDKLLDLSEETFGTNDEMPSKFTIEFRNVSFKYPQTERWILKNFNLKIEHGEKISIVGKNGEGKTTIIKLLLGLFIPDEGTILIGNKSLDSYSQNVRTRLFGPVFQDFVKYNMSIKDNIIVGNINDINDDTLLEVSKKAGVDDFVQNLDNKYETLIGKDFDEAIDLSGGQWQRIAIARALMKENSILILDEPTSQLDPMAESNIYKEFSKMTKNRTTIFVTHRLASTMITDKIYVIDEGRIIEEGTHKQLMKLKGTYSNMFNAQKKWYQKDGDSYER